MVDRGHKYVREKKGVTNHLKNGKTLFGPSVGKPSYLSGFRRSLDSSTFALATFAPGNILLFLLVDINTFRASLSGFRCPLKSSTFALATIAPGNVLPVLPVDINTFHAPYGHVHEKLLQIARGSS